MLQNLREKSKGIVFTALAGLLILSFAAWGIGDYINTAAAPTVGEVNGQEISARAFQERFRDELDNYGNRIGQPIDAEQAIAFGLHLRTLNAMVSERAFGAAVDEFGIAVSDELVRQRIFEMPAFQFEGAFDRATYRETLARSGITEEQFVASMKQQIAGEILGEGLLAAADLPAALPRALYAYSAETRTAELLVLPPEATGDVAAPEDESVLRDYYEENAAAFTAPERRDASLIYIDPESVSDQVAVSEEDLQAEFAARRGELETPEQRTSRMVTAETEAQAREIRSAVEGGAELADAAKQVLGEDAEVLTLGPIARDRLPEGMAEAVFSATPGDLVGPAESPFGWNVMILEEVTAPQTVAFEDVRDDLESDIRLRRAGDAVVDTANALEDEINSGATLEEAGEALGLEVRRFEGIDQSGRNADGERPEGLPQSRRHLTTLFALDAGEPSLLEETEEGNFFVVRPDEIAPSALRPFEEVREDVLAAWQEERRNELLAEMAEALRDTLPAEGPLDELAAEYGATRSATPAITRSDANPEGNLTAELVARLFEASPGDAVMAPAGDNYVVARLSEIREADPDADSERLEQIATSVDQSLESELIAQYESALRARYDASIDESAARFVITGER